MQIGEIGDYMNGIENNTPVNGLPEDLFEPIDATVKAAVSPDRLTGFIYITPPENNGRLISFEDVMSALKEAKITYGFDEDELRSIVDRPVYEKNLEIAHGKSPVHGKDGRIEVLFDNDRTKLPKTRSDGTVDFWELDLICNVQKGDKLIKIIKATPGEPGTDILGNTLNPKPGKPAVTPFGKNVVFNEDKTEIYAGMDGHVTYKNNQVAVDPTFRVQGDVDASTGNISFNGDVVVTGNVLDGFSIKALKHITVMGMVEGGKLEAGGNITVTGGIIGTLSDVIKCKGDLKCRFIENTTVRCEGDILADYITNSDVICEGSMTLQGSKAALIGGKYVVLKEITCRDIGSPNDVKTLVQLGSFGMIQEEHNAIIASFNKAEAEEKKVVQLIDYLNSMKDAAGNLDEEKSQILKDAVQTKTRLLIEKSRYHKKKLELEARMNYEGKQELVVKGTMYRGTQLTIKALKYTPDKDITYTRFYYSEEKNDIALGTI